MYVRCLSYFLNARYFSLETSFAFIPFSSKNEARSKVNSISLNLCRFSLSTYWHQMTVAMLKPSKSHEPWHWWAPACFVPYDMSIIRQWKIQFRLPHHNKQKENYIFSFIPSNFRHFHVHFHSRTHLTDSFNKSLLAVRPLISRHHVGPSFHVEASFWRCKPIEIFSCHLTEPSVRFRFRFRDVMRRNKGRPWRGKVALLPL